MSKEKQIIEIKECIDSVYGADCAYYDVDGFAIANEIYNAGYRKQSEVAMAICCEIEEEIVAALESNYRALKGLDDGRCNDYILEMVNRIKGKIDALRGIEGFVEELKKKYTEGEK